MPRQFLELTHGLVTPEVSTILEGVESPHRVGFFNQAGCLKSHTTMASEVIVLLGINV